MDQEHSRGHRIRVPELQAQPANGVDQPEEHGIVIVGGGLAGLTLACSLARHGVTALLLDEGGPTGASRASSRAIVYTQKSLEIFQRLGIYERIAAQGAQWSIGRTFAGIDEVYSFDVRQQAGFNLSAQPPFVNIQQFHVERLLAERIAELGHAQLRWQTRVIGLEQDAGGVWLTVEAPMGQRRLRAEQVVDATGARSPLRGWAGATMGGPRDDDHWWMADVRLDQQPPAERRIWIEAPFNDDRAVWQHRMADGVWRIDYQMAPDEGAAALNDEDAVRERLQRQFGAGTRVDIVWAGRHAYSSGIVDRMRHGRVFFIGDAARVVSPLGARGGNGGIADADNLAWKLAAVARGRAAPPLLDSYHDERHEAARQALLVTGRTARFLRPTERAQQLFRRAAVGLARQHPFARQLINTGRLAQAGSYTQSPVCAAGGGQSAQNATFRWPDGSAGSLNDLLLWAGGDLLLLVFGDLGADSRERLRHLARSAPVRAVQVVGDGRPQALEHVLDPQGHLQGACHVFGHAWALVRPDAYVAASGESIDAALVDAVGTALAMDQGVPA